MSGDTLKKILKEVQDISSKMNKLENDININAELSARILHQFQNLSCKIDEKSILKHLNSTVGDAESKTESAPSNGDVKVKASRVTINSYFKNKFQEDPKIFASILSDIEVNKVFADNETLLKSKKGQTLQNAKINLIFKELIKDKVEKENFIRNLMKSSKNEIKEDFKEE
jgi:hypothetical protein